MAEEFVVAAFGEKLSQQLEVNLSEANVEAIRLRKSFLLEHGFLPRDFELEAWIDPAPLREAQRIVKERALLKKQKAPLGKEAAQAVALT